MHDELPQKKATLRQLMSRGIAAVCLAGAWFQIDQAHAAGTSKTFSVHDYGAAADGVTDDQSAIIKTIKAASAWTNAASGNTATVLFPNATYALTKIYDFYAIDIIGLHDITLQGVCTTSSLESCTKLVGAAAVLPNGSSNINYNTFFEVSQSKNITIKNFSLDKSVPYFSQGKVQAINTTNRTIDVVPDANYLDLGGNLAQQMLNLVFFFPDPTSPYWDHSNAACSPVTAQKVPDQNCYNYHTLSKQPLAGGAWRFALDKIPSGTFVNGKFLLWKNVGWWYGITVDQSVNTAILNVFYTGGGGPAVHVQRSSGTTLIQNVVVDVPSGSGRLFAATSGFNGGHDRGAVVLDHVQVRHTDDDAFHFSAGAYYPALSQSSSNHVVRIATCYGGDFQPGDRIASLNWATKQESQEATVLSATVVTDPSLPLYPRQCELTLDTALPTLAGMQTFNPAMLGQATDSNDRIINLSANETLTVQNSYLSSMRSSCGIIQVSATYQNNICQNTPTGLLVGPAFMWGEGYPVQGAQIINSQFDHVGGTAVRIADLYDSVHPRTAAQIAGVTPSVVPSTSNSNLQIQNVSFTSLGNFVRGYDGIGGMAISVENAKGVTIGGNQYDNGAASEVVISPFTTQNVVGP